MAHTQSSSSGFSTFLFGVLATLLILAFAVFWFGVQQPERTASLERPAISIPLPKAPAVPPGVIPRRAEASPSH
jgi:hypothetical protein